MKTMTHRFVKLIPDTLQDNVLYISMEYRTVVHNCCCGCGKEVITPLSPTGWRLTYDGSAISLYPSLGNWNYGCKSHYCIINNKIVCLKKWKAKQIKNVGNVEFMEEEKYPDMKKPLSAFSAIFKK